MNPEEAARLFDEGWRLLPAWNAPPDPEREARALALIRESALAGHMPAIEAMADGMDPDHAFEWACTAARLGETGPLLSSLSSGDYPPEICQSVLLAARSGEPWAQVSIGRVYRLGMRDREGVLLATRDGAFGWLPGVADPNAEGLALLEAATSTGWLPAMLRLAIALQDTDPTRALHLVDQVAPHFESLVPKAQADVRVLHPLLLDRVPVPMEKRIDTYRIYADRGDAAAQSWLGDRYRLGDGVTRDIDRARSLYETAAASGDVNACRELGLMLEAGMAGTIDRERARELFERAAELGGDRVARQRLVEGYGLEWYAPGPDETPDGR